METDRLRLRPFSLADAATIQRLAGDQAIADTTVNIPHPYPDGAAQAWIRTHAAKFAAGELCAFAVTLSKSGELIGAIGLAIHPANESAELGYWIGRPFWNNRYASEAAQAVVDFGFQALALRRIYARHFRRNPASGRVMQKLGMHREGCLRQALKKGDRFEDLVLYAILRKEWERRRKRSDGVLE